MYMVPQVNGALIKAAESHNGAEAVGGEVEVRKMMSKFGRLNLWRGMLMGVGGVVGVWAGFC